MRAAALTLAAAMGAVSLPSLAGAFTDLCADAPAVVAGMTPVERDVHLPEYCSAVGKAAHNRDGPKALRDVFLGPIVGVAWQPAGSLISAAGQPRRYAAVDALHYIIGPGGVAHYVFVRLAHEIEPR